MVEIGEYVVCGAKGVCQIRDITHIDMSGADKEKLYYVLAPVGDKNGTIYVPTDSEKIIMRRTISKEEAERLIDELPCMGEHCKDFVSAEKRAVGTGKESNCSG